MKSANPHTAPAHIATMTSSGRSNGESLLISSVKKHVTFFH